MQQMSREISKEKGKEKKLESFECSFSLLLGTVAVNRFHKETSVVQIRVDCICCSFRVHENECLTFFLIQQIEQTFSFLVIFQINKRLPDVRRRAANSPDSDEKIVIEEVLSQLLDFSRECCAEHHRLTLANSRHVYANNEHTQ